MRITRRSTNKRRRIIIIKIINIIIIIKIQITGIGGRHTTRRINNNMEKRKITNASKHNM